MATVQTNISESVFQIKNWLGVNEAPEGETRLKQGEAAVMRNFKITAGGALKKRGGSINVAGLAAEFLLETYGDVQTLFSEGGISTLNLNMYPRATTDSVGTPIPEGSPVQVSFSSSALYSGYYYQYNGNMYQFEETDEIEPEMLSEIGLLVSGSHDNADYSLYTLVFSQPPYYNNGEWNLDDAFIANFFQGDGWYESGTVMWFPDESWYVIDGKTPGLPYIQTKNRTPTIEEFIPLLSDQGIYGYCLKNGFDDPDDTFYFKMEHQRYRQKQYKWNFYSVRSKSVGNDTVVRGLWSGFVGGREVLCAACSQRLWELEFQDGTWTKTDCGQIDTSKDVTMFGFQENLYILNGSQYRVWDGENLSDVTGYVPLVSTAVPPEGGGTLLEQVNKLSAYRRVRFSPDGEAKTFQLPETGIQSVESAAYVGGESISGFSTNTQAGTVTFNTAPEKGVSSLEVTYKAAADDSAAVKAMRYMELYNGAQDSRVFLYGDGTNCCLYSGLDENGQPRADYFPDLNTVRIGDENTPVTGMIRHYNKLLAFKLDSAWVISYDTITLADGSVTAGFYISPVNRSVGNCAPGQVLLVENQPRTLDGRSVVEWKASNSGSITGDQRNAKRVSQRVDNSIRKFNLETARTFYDKYAHEYYVIGSDGTALINGVDADAWYIYTDFDAVCLINYKDELYFGTADGYLRHFTETAFSDNGRAIDCYWESGSMPFDRDFSRKYSAMIWIGIKPEENGYLKVTAETDRRSDFEAFSFTTDDAGAVPTMHRLKLKAKKFTYYKLILENNTADTTATVVSADIRVRNTGYVR